MRQITFCKLERVLCLGAHSDDNEIGCGGTILKLLQDHPNLEVQWVVFSGVGVRAREARASARAFLGGARKRKTIVEKFRTSFFPFEGRKIKEFFEGMKTFDPCLIFTHYREDRHQDHRLISDLTWNTFRNHAILEYEIPKYDGDLGAPNFFVPLSKELCVKKVDCLLKFFKSQTDKHWFSRDLFMAAPRLRGMECNAPEGYAEAFYCRKSLLE